MGRHQETKEKKGAPATPEEAAERFLSETGIDLASDSRFVEIHRHLFSWRAFLAVAEYRPVVEALDVADAGVRSRSIRAIPTTKPIPIKDPPTKEELAAQALADATADAYRRLSDGLSRLRACVEMAEASELVPKVKLGRPENALDRALCLLLVESWEREAKEKPLSGPQTAYLAHAYGISEPSGSWEDWTERWRRLLHDARAEEPGEDTPRGRLLLQVRARRSALKSPG
jgi:hypothetical protein